MNLTALDFICIALIVGAGMIGYYKGAINTLISLAGFIASFIIARIFSAPLTNWLLNVESVKNFINNTITNNVIAAISNYSSEALAGIQSITGIEGLGTLGENANQALQSGGTAAADAVAQALQPMIYQITNLLVFVVLLMLCSFLFGIIRRLGRGVNRVPVIGTANRITGLGLGLIIGFIVACIVIAIVLYYGLFTAKLDVVQMVKDGFITGPIAIYLH